MDFPSSPIDMAKVMLYIGRIVSQFQYIIMIWFAMDLAFLLIRFLVVDVFGLGGRGIGQYEVSQAYGRWTRRP